VTILEQSDRIGWPIINRDPLHQLSDESLEVLGSGRLADVAFLLSPLPGQDQMPVRRRWDRPATDLPDVAAPAGAPLALLSGSVGCSRLRLLPLLGVPGSGPGRAMGSALAVGDGDTGLLVISRLRRRPGYLAADVVTLRELLRVAACRRGLSV
jgi:hypothetical protein